MSIFNIFINGILALDVIIMLFNIQQTLMNEEMREQMQNDLNKGNLMTIYITS